MLDYRSFRIVSCMSETLFHVHTLQKTREYTAFWKRNREELALKDVFTDVGIITARIALPSFDSIGFYGLDYAILLIIHYKCVVRFSRTAISRLEGD